MNVQLGGGEGGSTVTGGSCGWIKERITIMFHIYLPQIHRQKSHVYEHEKISFVS